MVSGLNALGTKGWEIVVKKVWRTDWLSSAHVKSLVKQHTPETSAWDGAGRNR